jgi:hypothetical protein
MLLGFGARGRHGVGLEAILIRRQDRAAVGHDVIDGRQTRRGIGVGAISDPLERALVNLRTRHKNGVAALAGKDLVAELRQFARTVAIIAAEPGPRVIQAPVLVAP